MSVKDMIAQAIFTTALDKLCKAAKKNGVDAEEADAVFSALQKKHWPHAALPLANASTTVGPKP